MNKNIVIGIEGMVAAGKTSTCIELVKLIPNCIFIDAGKIYRGIIEALRKNNIELEENNFSNINPMELMKKMQVEFKIEDGITQIYIGGKKVEAEEIESAENSMEVSKMATSANENELYKFARNVVDTYRKNFNIILSARDLVSLYPDMTCHIYITASLEERVKRRYYQYSQKYTLQEIENMIKQRDEIHEKAGFNKFYERSIKVDVTECKDAKESAKKVFCNIGGFINELCK